MTSVNDIKADYKSLNVWQKSVYLVTNIYTITKQYPSDELYGLVSQIRRAATSVPVNIAEGAVRNSSKEYVRFLHISQGSLAELETFLIISKNLGYVNEEECDELSIRIEEIKKMLYGLINYHKSKYQASEPNSSYLPTPNPQPLTPNS